MTESYLRSDGPIARITHEPAGVPQRAELGDDLRARRRVLRAPRPTTRSRSSSSPARASTSPPATTSARRAATSTQSFDRARPGCGGTTSASPARESRYAREAGGLPRHVPAVARAAQADDRAGAGRVHRRRPDARLGLRPDRRRRRRVLRRPGGADGHPRRRVLRPPLGDGPAAAPRSSSSSASGSTPRARSSSAWSTGSCPRDRLEEEATTLAEQDRRDAAASAWR